MNDEYEIKVEQNKDINKKYITDYEQWLYEKGLVKKTIIKHLNNIDLYINEYLNYYDITRMEDGISCVYSFLNDWFIEKCIWASKNSLKEIATSIKKFYQCMYEKNYVSKDDYKLLCNLIKENMDEFLDQIDLYDNESYYNFF